MRENEKDITKVTGRNWAFIVYPESVPSNWKKIIEEDLLLPCAISPLHDKDMFDKEDQKENKENVVGTTKKPHYHVIICWDNSTTLSNVLSTVAALGVTHVKKVYSLKGMFDYLTHKNNPKKAQYKFEDIELLNGFDVDKLDLLNGTDKQTLYNEIEDILEDYNLNELYSLNRYLRKHNLKEHLALIRNAPVYINLLIRSKRHYKEEELVDREDAVRRAYIELQKNGYIEQDTSYALLDLFKSL